MLTHEHMMLIEKQKRYTGSDEGSCFGVPDTSFLRKPFNKSVRKFDNSFKRAKREEYIGKNEGSLIHYSTIDRYLINNKFSGKVKARVLNKFYGLDSQKEKFLENKVQFSDVKTKKVHYIVKTF